MSTNPYMTPEAEALLAAAGAPGEELPPPVPAGRVKTPQAADRPNRAKPRQRAQPAKAKVSRSQRSNTVIVTASSAEDGLAAALEAAEEAAEYPRVFYNPRVIDERFMVVGSPYPKRFVQGRFVAQDATDEASVRGALRAYGKDAADRWSGEDRSQEWVCQKCGFRTFLDRAKYDHEYLHGH